MTLIRQYAISSIIVMVALALELGIVIGRCT